MANPYFNATYYLANNPDVFAAGINTVEGAWAHYEQYGAAEALTGSVTRSPAPWFDIAYYLAQNPDLATAGLTAAQLFEHFTTYGIAEGRQPSADANVNADSLAAYAAANEDLRDAFGIEEGEELTEEQLEQLAQHYYTYGYQEEREGKPVSYESNPGDTFTLTEGLNEFVGTSGDDTFQGEAAHLNGFDSLDGGAGNDTLNLYAGTAPLDSIAPTVKVKNIETININGAAYTSIDAARFEGAKEVWQIGNATSITDVSASQAAGFRDTGIVAGAAGVAVSAAASAEAIHVALDNVGGEGESAEFTVAINGANVTTLNVSGTFAEDGAKLGLGALPAEIDTINLALQSDVVVALYSDAVEGLGDVTTINASASTGGLDFTGLVNYGDGIETTLSLESLTLGSGVDSVVLTTAALSADEVAIDLGAGNDLIGLIVSDGSDADITVDAGAGVDQIVVQFDGVSDSNIVLTGGAGGDTFTFFGTNVAVNADDDGFAEDMGITSITDFGNGSDVIQLEDFNNFDGSFAAQNAVDNAIAALDDDATLFDAVQAVAALNGVYAQFAFGETTYLYGGEGLLVDLGGATLSAINVIGVADDIGIEDLFAA